MAPAPAPGDEKVKVAVVAPTTPAGPVSMTVSGLTLSTSQLWRAADWSKLPAASLARTRKTWLPSSRSIAV